MRLTTQKFKVIPLGLIFAFSVTMLGPLPLSQAQDYFLPAPGVMVHLSVPFHPPMLKALKVHADNPFRFDFILDQGDSILSRAALSEESRKLVKYFMASLTIPEKDLWVNLSPYERQRIIPRAFGQTEMGRDLLAEDYMLKQISASLIYPQDMIGKQFWMRVYQEAARRFGTTNIPVNTFNKVWIVPQEAVVYENAKAGTAYVEASSLKVMLEEDYLALEKNTSRKSVILSPRLKAAPEKEINYIGSQIVREIVIPELTKEVNEDKNFAPLRQVYNSLILATWYKKKIRESILAQVYENKNKIAGVTIDDRNEKEKIYQQYLRAFKKGVFNYIKDDIDPVTRESTPRKYFSGGFSAEDLGEGSTLSIRPMPRTPIVQGRGLLELDADINAAMNASEKGDKGQTLSQGVGYGILGLSLLTGSGLLLRHFSEASAFSQSPISDLSLAGLHTYLSYFLGDSLGFTSLLMGIPGLDALRVKDWQERFDETIEIGDLRRASRILRSAKFDAEVLAKQEILLDRMNLALDLVNVSLASRDQKQAIKTLREVEAAHRILRGPEGLNARIQDARRKYMALAKSPRGAVTVKTKTELEPAEDSQRPQLSQDFRIEHNGVVYHFTYEGRDAKDQEKYEVSFFSEQIKEGTKKQIFKAIPLKEGEVFVVGPTRVVGVGAWFKTFTVLPNGQEPAPEAGNKDTDHYIAPPKKDNETPHVSEFVKKAFEKLGLAPGASESEIREAYAQRSLYEIPGLAHAFRIALRYVSGMALMAANKQTAIPQGLIVNHHNDNDHNDNAQVSATGLKSPTGGIDLSSDKALTVKNNANGIQFHVDPSQLSHLQDAPGFTIGSIRVQPLINLQQFLGV